MKLRALWMDLRASYWFIPSILTTIAFLLAIATVTIDRNGGSEWWVSLGLLEPSRPEGARAQLTVIASAAIAIASTVFAITIAAVAYASGNYGPRLLTNFMNDRGNQLSLGVFIATFVYNLMVLRVVRNPQLGETSIFEAAAFVPQISLIMSTVTVIVAVAVLVYFLHHVPASIRINSVLAGIGRRLIRDIEERFATDDENGRQRSTQRPEQIIVASEVGYIELIAFDELDDIARDTGLVLSLQVRTGDFVHPSLPLVGTTGGRLDEKTIHRIRGCFELGTSRTATQNLEFLIDELVEIAVRALSPGINDPFTAITSMHWMAAALAKLGERSLSEGPEERARDPHRVRAKSDDFAHFLKRSFGSVRPSAATNAIAAPLFIDALRGVFPGLASRDRREQILEEARLLVAQACHELNGPALAELEAQLEQFEAIAREERDGGSEGSRG